jgi:hypothetical protein
MQSGISRKDVAVYKRAYGIALKPDLPDGAVAGLVGALENAPAYLPGMTHSVVRPALGPGPYDLVWDNGFVDTASFEGYLAHPYHCNVIDHYMYRESPAAVISSAFVMRWSDEDGPLPGATGAALPAVDPAPETGALPADPTQGPLHLVEQISVLPGRIDDYLAALDEDYLPMTRDRGLRQLLCLRSPAGTGEDELLIIWQLADWNAFVEFRAFFQFENEPASGEWVARSSALRTGGRRRLMLATGPVRL